MADKIVFKRIELHVTHVCNLACESCSHYSNHNHSGSVSLAEAESWMAPWRGRFDVEEFVLLGGEPTTHPDLTKFIPLVRRYWPNAAVWVVTNGFFLDRHPDLARVLAEGPNAVLGLSMHYASESYRERIRPALELMDKWRLEYPVKFHVWESSKHWTRRYLGYGDDMAPFEDGNASESWRICPAKHCRQLFEGKIWKCSPLAYLQLQSRKFSLSQKWDKYLAYEPLPPGCDDEALKAFHAREVEPFCEMCSAQRRLFSLPNPIRGSQKPNMDASVEAPPA